jgi:hypothetical protein
MDLHHFFHCYADGAWEIPVHEHIGALRFGGLYDQLASFQIGFVGSDDNIERVCDALAVYGVNYTPVASVTQGFEQETLDKLYDFSQDHDGAVLYTHTKGSSRVESIDNPWRQSMEQLCVVDWRVAVAALECDGKSIVGCHWIKGDPDIERLAEAWRNRELNPPGLDGVGGMFGGNFWWTRLELVRQNCRPGRESRFAAEHWLGQLSEVMPINVDTILDLNPVPITRSNLVPLRLA